MPRPCLPAQEIEARRRKAMALLDQGLSLNEVGRLLGCAPSSIMRWRNRRMEDGEAGLTVRFSTGRPTKLTAALRQRLLRLLASGPRRAGFDREDWTREIIVNLIQREFGVGYDPTQIGRILKSLGWEHRAPDGWRAISSQ